LANWKYALYTSLVIPIRAKRRGGICFSFGSPIALQRR